MKKLVSRHFKKQHALPRMVSREESELGLFLFSTPWGDESATQMAFDEIINHLKTSHQDSEVTTAFEKIEILNRLENDLRAATLVAAEKIFQSINQKEYTSALELTIISQQKHQLTWLTAGGHQIWISQGNAHSVVCGAIPHRKSPLPVHLVGVDRHCWMQCGSLNAEKQSEIHIFSDGNVSKGSQGKFPESSRDVSFWVATLLNPSPES